MKNYTYMPAIALCAMSLTSCVKNAAKTTSSHYLNATTSSSTSFAAADPRLQGVNDGTVVNMKGNQTDGASLGFIVPKTLGTHTIDGSTCGAQYNPVPYTMGGNATHGTITLTALTPDLVGSFHFTCVDSTVVTGTFDMAAP